MISLNNFSIYPKEISILFSSAIFLHISNNPFDLYPTCPYKYIIFPFVASKAFFKISFPYFSPNLLIKNSIISLLNPLLYVLPSFIFLNVLYKN